MSNNALGDFDFSVATVVDNFSTLRFAKSSVPHPTEVLLIWFWLRLRDVVE